MPTPTIQEALRNAVEHQSAGHFNEAIAICRQILASNPDHPEALHLLGQLAHQTGQNDQAALLIQHAISIKPTAAAYYNSLAIVLLAAGNPEQAASLSRRAIQLRPELPAAHNTLGTALQQLRLFDQAVATFQQALTLQPNLPEAHMNLGNTFKLMGNFHHAIGAYRRAISLRPQYALAIYNLANVLALTGDLDQAIEHYRQALITYPSFPKACVELGNAQSALGKMDEAIAAYRQALAIDNTDPDSHCALGVALLKHGEYPEGWAQYEWRWRNKEFAKREKPPTCPRWNGGEIAGLRLLIHAEQGFGDVTQFARYIPLVARRGAKVIFKTPPELHRLLRNLPGITEISANPDAASCDFHCPMMSLPLIFGTTLQTIPPQAPPIAAEESLASTWRQRVGPKTTNLRVGLAWSGGPEPFNYRNRAISLAELAPLSAIPGIEFISLQKDHAERHEEIRSANFPLTDWTPHLEDFAETAAMMAQLDLIISIDSAVAHLAGAMGKPVWLLARFSADWRWLLNRDDSPWYPTMRLFRQPKPADWQTPVNRIVEALATKLKGQ